MSIRVDVLVVGSGVAGALAAARAQERGLSVYKITKSLGASGYSSGAVDDHKVAQEAVSLFQKITAPLNYTSSHWVASETGIAKRCLLVQGSQAFDLSLNQPEDHLGVVEFSCLTEFRSAPVVAMLNAQGYHAHPITVNIPSTYSFLGFAKKFQESEFLDACIEAIDEAVSKESILFKHLFLPAVLGLDSPWLFLKSLSIKVGVGFSELLGLSHSIPGLRLGQLLSEGFEKASIIEFEKYDGRIRKVILDNGKVLEPSSIVLATGRFLSGGFVEKEAIFGLPLTNKKRFYEGLAYDRLQRPLGEFSVLFAENLFAAGSSLGGYDPAVDGGMAVAISTGYRAGDLC